MNYKTKTFLTSFILVLFLITPFFSVKADSFGGVITELIVCNCNSAIHWYRVSDPVGGPFVRVSDTHQYDCSPTALGEWILGLAFDYMVPCLFVCGETCCSVSGYRINFYGSSDYYDCNSSSVITRFDNLGIEGGNSNVTGDGNNDSSRERSDGSSSIPGTPIGADVGASSTSNSGGSSSTTSNTQTGDGELNETGLSSETIAMVTEENRGVIISENNEEEDQAETGETQSLQSPEAVDSFRDNLRTILATAGVITVGTAGAVAFVIIRRRA